VAAYTSAVSDAYAQYKTDTASYNWTEAAEQAGARAAVAAQEKQDAADKAYADRQTAIANGAPMNDCEILHSGFPEIPDVGLSYQF
jgi:hypothetical protein